jgi:two-component system OmpR family sensor kinase
MTLQRRVLGYLVLAAIVSCTLSFGIGIVLVRHKISTQRLAGLVSTANALALAGGAPGQAGGAPGQASGANQVYRIVSGRPIRVRPALATAILASLPTRGNGAGTFTFDGRSLLYAARITADGGRIVLVRPARLAFGEWSPFLASLALAGILGVLLAVVLSYLLARRLTRPIGRLAGATQRVASGEPNVTVPVTGDEELAGLGRAFNAMSTDLTQARESQRAFLESVSHELKTPLTSIRGYAEALEEGAVSAEEGARIISGEAGRLERLVVDLLDLARFGRADFAVRHESIDLRAVASESVRRHLPRAQELRIALTCRAGGDLDGDADGVGDEDRLLQSTSNLIENALRLTPAGGEITVLASPGKIAVRDTGPGLAPEDVGRAFDRFYLYNRYRSERAVGSGLGLAIVRELVTAMGGTVEASQAPGGGAEFTVRLARPTGSPLRPAQPAQPGAVRPSA